MGNEPKVLRGLLERRAVETAFSELARTTDPGLRAKRAEEIASHGDVALWVLLSLLDSSDPALRGRLGQVAVLLPHEQVVAELRAVARARERSDQARVAAAALLDRHLGEPIDQALLAPLDDPDTAALQSLRELICAMEQDPLAILEFLDQLAEQPREVAVMLVDAVPAAGDSPHLATLLRILAQAPDQLLARRSLDVLGHMRSPAAAHALGSLVHVLPPALAGLAQRSARKLRFSGHRPEDVTASGWPWIRTGANCRVLLSPVDANGLQLAWFISPGAEQVVFLTIVSQDPIGIRSANVAVAVDGSNVPRSGPVGSAYSLSSADGSHARLVLLEASHTAGAQVVREALELNWSNGTSTPFAFRLFSPLVFPEVESCDLVSGEDAVQEAAADDGAVLSLMAEPLFGGWFWELERVAKGNEGLERVLTPELVASYGRRLRSMARWFTIAGDTTRSALAREAARILETVPIHESPLITRLLETWKGPAH